MLISNDTTKKTVILYIESAIRCQNSYSRMNMSKWTHQVTSEVLGSSSSCLHYSSRAWWRRPIPGNSLVWTWYEHPTSATNHTGQTSWGSPTITSCACVREQGAALGWGWVGDEAVRPWPVSNIFMSICSSLKVGPLREDLREEVGSETGVIHLRLQSGTNTFWEEWMRHSRGRLLYTKHSCTRNAKEMSLTGTWDMCQGACVLWKWVRVGKGLTCVRLRNLVVLRGNKELLWHFNRWATWRPSSNS